MEEVVMDILVRAREPRDAEALWRIANSPRAYSGTLQMPFPSQELWRQRATAAEGDGNYFLVAEVDGEVVGSTGLHIARQPRRRHVGEFGMMVRDDMQGKGVGSALMKALLELADGWLNLTRIELTVYSDNPAAIALYQKFGFVIEGTHAKFAFRDGEYIEAHTMARLK
jgi:putative acetyltransferase